MRAESGELERVVDAIVESLGSDKSERREHRASADASSFKSLSNGNSQRRELTRVVVVSRA